MRTLYIMTVQCDLIKNWGHSENPVQIIQYKINAVKMRLLRTLWLTRCHVTNTQLNLTEHTHVNI